MNETKELNEQISQDMAKAHELDIPAALKRAEDGTDTETKFVQTETDTGEKDQPLKA